MVIYNQNTSTSLKIVALWKASSSVSDDDPTNFMKGQLFHLLKTVTAMFYFFLVFFLQWLNCFHQ